MGKNFYDTRPLMDRAGAATLLMLLCLAGCRQGKQPVQEMTYPVRLITLDPGHFHAALVQKSGYSGIDPQVYVYAPSGPELQSHLSLIEKYNTRGDRPTAWREQVYAGPDYLARMFADKKGNLVIIAGNNQKKTAYIRASIDSGFNVLADKPMAISADNFALLEKTFTVAARNKKLLYDIMTERYQISNILQKMLSRLPEVFGRPESGTVNEPAVVRESVHHFYKEVSGKPLLRPAWSFDVAQQGEGLVDVTTHLVDLIQWSCFPEQAIDYKKDIRMLTARHWPTRLSLSQFSQVTGLDQYPAFLAPSLQDSILQVYANGEMNYSLKGIHARVSVQWNFQAPVGGGDTEFSLMRGSLSNLVIRQGKEEQFKPVLTVEPIHPSPAYGEALRSAVNRLALIYPGLALKAVKTGWELIIPQRYTLDHEGSFAEVMKNYLRYLKDQQLPSWEVPDMLAKYYTTTQALEMARSSKSAQSGAVKKVYTLN